VKVVGLSSLKRQAAESLAGLRADKDPILITMRRKPAAYLVDVARYEDVIRRLAVVEGIALGEQAIRDRRILTSGDVKRRLARWLS